MIYEIFSNSTENNKELSHYYPNFKEGSLAARAALAQCIKKENLSLAHPFDINYYHHLEKMPHILVSLSHTKSIGAAAIAYSDHCHSIGIDIEAVNEAKTQISNQLNEHRAIKKLTQQIGESTSKIDNKLDKIRRNIIAQIANIDSTISHTDI